jgi:hypothetical protein
MPGSDVLRTLRLNIPKVSEDSIVPYIFPISPNVLPYALMKRLVSVCKKRGPGEGQAD